MLYIKVWPKKALVNKKETSQTALPQYSRHLDKALNSLHAGAGAELEQIGLASRGHYMQTLSQCRLDLNKLHL